MPQLDWMAWTWQTGLFFALIGLALIIMTLLAAVRPEAPRRGILGFPTTRGDRLFVSLLGTAVICILWIAFGLDPIWPALGVSALFAALMFRYA